MGQSFYIHRVKWAMDDLTLYCSCDLKREHIVVEGPEQSLRLIMHDLTFITYMAITVS